MSKAEIRKLVLKDHVKAFMAVKHHAQIRLRNLFGVEMVQLLSKERKAKKGNAIIQAKLKSAYILKYLPII